MIQLHFYPSTAAMVPHILLEELGVPYERVRIDRENGALIAQLDAELARHGGPWFLGGAYSLLDAYVFTLCRWTRHFPPDSPVRPAREYPHLGPYLQRMLERPSLQRVMVNEGLSPAYV